MKVLISNMKQHQAHYLQCDESCKLFSKLKANTYSWWWMISLLLHTILM